ncbi:cytochrome P450 93A3-like [Aristolochia californica]|uniref:cytochrome P450 93A3-like n=1 Tax=Aristolochia californica TaxID=171875 RepID=UPI0035DF2987
MPDHSTYAMFFFLWLVSTLLLRIIFSKTRTAIRLPPGPRALPIVGHLHLLAPIPHQALHKLSTRYGPLMHIRLGSVSSIVSSSAETAKEFLKTQELHFSSRPSSAVVRYLTYGSADFSFAPYGPYWKFMKKLCMSELLGGRTLDQLLPVRREELKQLVTTLALKAQLGKPVDMGGGLLKLTNNVISRMTMSKRCTETEGEADDVRKLVEEVAELTGKFNLADYISFCKNLDLQGLEKRYKDLHLRFDRMMETIIKEKEEANKMKKGDAGLKDLLDILLEISEDDKADMKITRENIKAFILDIFVAGTDTSAITMEWALAELINHPDILRKTREEIDSVVGKARLVDESDITNLPYLQAIVKETLRLHPTGPLILRESTKDCSILGYDIPANTRLFVNVWAIGRDPNHWENPLNFRPERFMPTLDDSSRSPVEVRGQHFHLLPFGSGRRGCPGTSLALQVIQTTLAALIQCFEWKFGNGEANAKVDMTEAAGLTLPRSEQLLCTPVLRLNSLPSMD